MTRDISPRVPPILDRIDTKKDGGSSISRQDRERAPREPDAVHWIDDNRFVTANEGDWKGGTRGFTIYQQGPARSMFESGRRLEHEVVRLGHYPDKRNKKGIEIEGMESRHLRRRQLIFVGSERGSLVASISDKGAARRRTSCRRCRAASVRKACSPFLAATCS